MNDKFQIKTCPTCGSEKIRRVARDVTRKYKGRTYIVPNVGFYNCLNCGEKVYDHEAMLKIETYSPAYHNAKAAFKRIHKSEKITA